MRKDSLGLWWQDVKIPKPPPVKRAPPERTWESPDYLPGLEEAIAFNVPLYTFEEIQANIGEQLLFDIECYENYFLICFMSYKTGKCCYFEMYDGCPLNKDAINWIINNFELISFNGIKYDMCILALALAGKDCSILKSATQRLIVMGDRVQDVLKSHKVKGLKVNHIDLIEVAPLFASLKIYGGSLHAPKMQDLPFSPDTILSRDQMLITRLYFINDLTNTGYLRHALTEELDLRVALSKEYNQDLRSKSDAQIAEHVIAAQLGKMCGVRPKPPEIDPHAEYAYAVPHFINYETDVLKQMLETVRSVRFEIDAGGSVGLPEALKSLKLTIGGSTYTMGIGGLHSTEKGVAHFADADTIIEDRDVTSYYPQIILNLGIYPEHLGQNFLNVYRGIVQRRIAAKEAGRTTESDGLKITANGTFGKLGSQYSVLYSPDLLIQVTITGQLSLLMLIERLEMIGLPVVSANTDGIVIKCPTHRQPEMRDVIAGWEADTNFKTEGTNYKAIYSKDVNNYIAVLEKPKKGVFAKTKGAYAEGGLKKRPTNQIVTDAVINFLVDSTPIEDTIINSRDIRGFVQVRTVNGGAVKNSEYLGKAIRWYYAAGEEGDIIYASNGHTVPRSSGAKPLMTLPSTMPSDVDYARYIQDAYDVLKDIGHSP